ncbi:unnamed protein product, partial [Mesorhabditis belari]|uniref:Uncharacterized protein n=1 Tax=Mesorhabditis belari TaxID=2138241 RepID=A0AAF3FK99_9BILA
MKLLLLLPMICVLLILSDAMTSTSNKEEMTMLSKIDAKTRVKRQWWGPAISGAWYAVKNFHPRGYGSWHAVFGG